MEISFDDVISVQSTSVVFKSCHPTNGSRALKCVASHNGGCLHHEKVILDYLLAHPNNEGLVGNIPEVFAIAENVAPTVDAIRGAPFVSQLTSMDILVITFFKAAPLHKLFHLHPIMPECVARLLLRQTCQLLRSLHSCGVVYVDLKLPNIIVNEFGEVKLVDFGSSEIVQQGEPVAVEKLRRGTLHIRAPELFLDKAIARPFLCDFWAFGVCACELLSGRPPFGTFETCGNSPDAKLALPTGISVEAASLIESLLRAEQQRLGSSGGWDEVLAHPFFARADDCFPEEYQEEVDMQTLGL